MIPKIIAFVLLLGVCALGCKSDLQSNLYKWNYDSIDHSNELYLVQTDDRYGEWGGNTFVLRIYRENQTKQILMDYTEYEGKEGPRQPPHPDSIPSTILEWLEQEPIVKEKRRIEVSAKYQRLIADAIQELIELRINNAQFVAMSGVVNSVIYSDSSLVIRDYPSTDWKEFQIIRNEIEN